MSKKMNKNKWETPQIQQLNIKDTKDGSQANGRETWNGTKFTKGS